MRCQFCGWDNPQGKENCEKCNKPLAQSDPISEMPPVMPGTPVAIHTRPTERKIPDGAFNPKATIRESDAAAAAPSPVATVNAGAKAPLCPECGNPLVNGVCEYCGDKEEEKAEETTAETNDAVTEVRRTFRPKRKAHKKCSFALTPISEDTGLPEGDPIGYEGSEVALNRDNTSPDNLTITSDKQAVVTCEDGVWTIEDCSEFKTTFVQAARKTELRDGDLILIGTQLYRFN